jgi:predicted phage terminase large subunit-like protein
MTYDYEARAHSRSVVRQLNTLSNDVKISLQRGLIIPTEAEKRIVELTKTTDPSRQVDVLSMMAERVQSSHLAKLLPLAKNEFNAFCEYVNPDEPPESKWHIWLTDLLQRVETDPSYQRIVLNVPPGHAKPLIGSTLVLMHDGSYKRLDQIKVGNKVITHKGRARKVLAVHQQGKLPVLKVATRFNREIIAASDHPFLTNTERDNPYKNAADLMPGDELVLGSLTKSRDHSGHSIDDFTLAAYFGAQAGRTYSPNRKRTQMNRNVFLYTNNMAARDDMMALLKRMGIECSTWRLTADNVSFIKIFKKHGDELASKYRLDDRAKDRVIPEFVFKGDDTKIKKFISTFVNMRGAILQGRPYPNLIVSIPSRTYAKQLQSLLARYGVAPVYRETGGDKIPAAQLRFLPRQIEAYIQHFTFSERLATRFTEKRKHVEPLPPFDAIHSVLPAGEEECFCLTVEEDSTFVANDVIVHNSTYASRLYVAWRLGRRPRDKIIGGGHSQTFVENEFSKKIRGLVTGKAYHDVFPEIVISSDTRAAAQWALAGTEGQYTAKGAGQSVHGFRANFVCVDDPYGKIEDAESPAMREKVKTWFFGDLCSRLLPGATVFVIMTRFNEHDLTGEIIEANKRLAENARYKIFAIPAICYDPDNDMLKRSLGEVLWEYYNLAHFQTFRATWSFARFFLVFQQSPSAADDTSIASKIKFYRTAPHLTDAAIRDAKDKNSIDPETGRVLINKRDYYRRIVASVDTASTKTERSDYTVVQIWGLGHDGKHYLLDQDRKKVEFNDMISTIERLARLWEVDAILIEDKGAGNSYLQHRGATDGQKRAAPAPLVAIKVNPAQGKEFRFDEISPLIEAGEVWVPEDASWTELFMQELGQFPDGAHDDQVDAMSQALKWFKGKRRGRYGSRKVTSMG